MNTYDVIVKMTTNRPEKHIIVNATSENNAKYRAKKIARTADGQYPKVTSIKMICELYSDGNGHWMSVPE